MLAIQASMDFEPTQVVSNLDHVKSGRMPHEALLDFNDFLHDASTLPENISVNRSNPGCLVVCAPSPYMHMLGDMSSMDHDAVAMLESYVSMIPCTPPAILRYLSICKHYKCNLNKFIPWGATPGYKTTSPDSFQE